MRPWSYILPVLAFLMPFSTFADDMASMPMSTATATSTTQTLTLKGTLVDTNCYLEEGDTGDDHGGDQGCGRACLKSGIPAGLLVGTKLYILITPCLDLMDYVGKTIEATGVLYGDNLFMPNKHKVFLVNADGSKKNLTIHKMM